MLLLRQTEIINTRKRFLYKVCSTVDIFGFQVFHSASEIILIVTTLNLVTFFTFSSLFSMDGDFAPMVELSKLRKKHGFLFVIDDVSILFITFSILVIWITCWLATIAVEKVKEYTCFRSNK